MSIHTYLQTVTAVSILCTVVRSLTDKTAQRTAVSMFCGICMLTAVLLPLKTGVDELSRIQQQLSDLSGTVEITAVPAVTETERLTREYAASAANSYLETQFSTLTGESCTVEVVLDEALHPISAQLTAPTAYRETLILLCRETLGLDENALEFMAEAEKEVP